MEDPRLNRQHKILAEREDQIELNLAAITGGRPYIDARLARLPYESDTSWSGGGYRGKSNTDDLKDSVGGNEQGRSNRAFLINYASRIAKKINQYVFSTPVQREGANPVFLADTTRTGLTITDVMARASEIVTGARWGWISVDRNSLPLDVEGNPVQRSMADKEASGDRVYWSIWEPQEVVDWHFDKAGKLSFVITEQMVYDNSDFTQDAVDKPVRTIWRRDGGIRLWLNPEDHEKIDKEETFTTSLDEVGFVPVGTPTSKPWWFDDVEGVQASILNLDSVHGENMYQTVFPQLILPAGILQELMDTLKISGEAVLEMLRGLNYPIFEPADAHGTTRYLTPSAGDLKAIPDEILRRRKELFEIVGLAMQNPNNSKQTVSAESKAWDNLDPEAVLKERAIMLQESEMKAVILSKKLDPEFKEYTPIYSQTFNVRNVSDDIQTLLDIKKLPLPNAANKEVVRAGVEILDRVIKIPEERKKKIIAEIDNTQNKEKE